MKDLIYQQARDVIKELHQKVNLKKGSMIVIGCSTSEVLGAKIGTNSSMEIAEYIFKGLWEYALEQEFYLAVQCCEHLNRTIITEQEAAPFAEILNVVPQPKAGGSLATQAYTHFKHPIAIESIQADAGLDIGFTLIGMHLKKVAVPVRLEHHQIGEATVIAARTRPKFVGGIRAVYNQDLL